MSVLLEVLVSCLSGDLRKFGRVLWSAHKLPATVRNRLNLIPAEPTQLDNARPRHIQVPDLLSKFEGEVRESAESCEGGLRHLFGVRKGYDKMQEANCSWNKR